jgi:hypothetical protein
MVLLTQSAAAITIIPVVVVVALTGNMATVQTTAALAAAATAMDMALHVERQQHITVAVAEQAVILIQVPADPDIKVLLLYDIEISKGKIWQRYRI